MLCTPRLPALPAALFALVACSSSQPTAPRGPRKPAPAAPTTTAPAAPTNTAPARPATLRSDAFGGPRWGFVEASTRNGRLVVLRRFTGDDPPAFGHHGETREQPEVTVFDRVSGDERTIDEIIDIDPTRRWLLLLGDGQLWLAEATSGVWQPLDGADMDPDGNACLPPRQASFSASGKRVAWVSAGATALEVRDLDSGQRWSIPARGKLWRGWPEDEERAAILAEVAAGVDEWPRQNTSCACRWCNRFAMSAGYYGWSGPAFTLERVDADGKREKGDPPESKSRWHGDTESGCTLVATSQRAGLDRGPWQWKCP